MSKKDMMPSETEWLVMEIIWNSDTSLTSAEIIAQLKDVKHMAPKTVRVLISRLCQKGLLDYTIDQTDSRVYHYFPLKTKDICLKEKSRHFVDSYFSGNGSGAVAALVGSVELSEQELIALSDILKSAGKQHRK